MKAGKLSDVQIRHWIAAGKPVSRSDGDGLTFTLSAAGTAAWVLRYPFGGVQKEVTLGRHKDLGLAGARTEAAALRLKVEKSIDVAAEKKARKAAERNTARTVKDLGAEYVQAALTRPKPVKQVRHMLGMQNFDINPAIGAMPLAAVTTGDVAGIVQKIRKRGAPVKANRVLSHISTLFDFAVRHDYMPHNPASRLKRIDAGGTESARERVLSDSEITTVLTTLDAVQPGCGLYSLVIRLLLLLGVRKLELLHAEWQDFYVTEGYWLLVKARQKTGNDPGAQDFKVPLTARALELLTELKHKTPTTPYLFPALRRGKNGNPCINQASVNWTLGKMNFGIPRFTIHDMRRTARTQLAALKVPRDVAEKYLNHKGDRYDVHDYYDERREAMELLGAKLDALAPQK